MPTQLDDIQARVAELKVLVSWLLLGPYTPHKVAGVLSGNKLCGDPEVVARAMGTPIVQLELKSYGPATFLVEASKDGVTWKLWDTIVFSGATEDTATYINAYAYVRVRTTAPNEITVVAGR